MERSTSSRWGGEPLETTVVASRRLTPLAHAIELSKPSGFSFLATQFTFLTLETERGADVRPMSIATSPTRPNLEYAVRVSDSPFKRAFASLQPGDKVGVQGPFGRFLLDERRPAVLLAGGIGITPLKGMAEYASDKALPIPVRLVYSNRAKADIVYRAELDELERRNRHFRVFHTLTGTANKGWKGTTGRLGDAQIRRATEGLHMPVYYICGSPDMVAEMVRILTDFVPQTDIRAEVFRGYRAG